MAVFVFDASAMVKRYLNEPGSGWVRVLADPAAANEIYVSRICRVEVIAAVTRRRHGHQTAAQIKTAMLAQFRHDAVHQYTILEITPTVLTVAEQLAETHGLRGYDAVQLAATLELHQARSEARLSPITFVSADNELNVAAIAVGLAVENPNSHS